jgi:hypothetical protein
MNIKRDSQIIAIASDLMLNVNLRKIFFEGIINKKYADDANYDEMNVHIFVQNILLNDFFHALATLCYEKYEQSINIEIFCKNLFELVYLLFKILTGGEYSTKNVVDDHTKLSGYLARMLKLS